MIAKSKIRRRRKKINKDLADVETSHQQTSPPTLTDLKNPYRSDRKPKLNAVYVGEEQEIQKCLTYRMQRKSIDYKVCTKSPSASQKLQWELDFFHDGLMLSDEQDLDEKYPMMLSSGNDKQSLDGVDGQLLASSFVLIDHDIVAEVWKPMLIEKADPELFIKFKGVTNNHFDDDNDSNFEELRDLNDDGLFVYERASRVSKSSENFIIKRLLLANKNDCVRVQGKTRILIGLPESHETSGILYRSICSKQFIPTHYEPRFLHDVGTVNVYCKTTELHLFFESIEWDFNYDLNEEEMLTQTIQELYSHYQQSNQINDIGRLVQKLQSVRDLLEQFEKLDEKDDREIQQFIFDRRDLRNKIHREHQTIRDNILAILDKWTKLKDLRKRQGFAGTNLKLVIHTTETDMEADKRRWDLDFNYELNEVLEEAIQFYITGHRLRLRNGGGDGLDVEYKKPNPEEIEDMLYDIFLRSRRHPGEPIVRLEIQGESSNNGSNMASLCSTQKIAIQIQVGKTRKEVIRTTSCVANKIILNFDCRLIVTNINADGCYITVSIILICIVYILW